MRLQILQGAAHHGVGDRRADRAGHEAAGIDAQVQLGARALAAEVYEAPLAREVPEVAAEVLAAEPARRLVHLAQLVADALDLRVDLVLPGASGAEPATVLVFAARVPRRAVRRRVRAFSVKWSRFACYSAVNRFHVFVERPTPPLPTR